MTTADQTSEPELPAKCQHGLLLAPPPMYAALECRLCVSPTESVDEWIDAHPGPTFEEIGRVLGVTRERIRQIEAKALARLDPRFVAALGLTDADRGELLSDAERRDRVVARMRRDGMTEDEITDAIGSDERARAVGNARERNAT